MSYVLPLGPYHPSLEEPVHVKLYTEGELIKKSEVFIGYNHRGIEKLTEVRNYIQTITLVERVCGICSHSHAMTYCLAIEDIVGMLQDNIDDIVDSVDGGVYEYESA